MQIIITRNNANNNTIYIYIYIYIYQLINFACLYNVNVTKKLSSRHFLKRVKFRLAQKPLNYSLAKSVETISKLDQSKTTIERLKMK